MSNFNIPHTRIEPARMEPITDSQMAKVESYIRLIQIQVREAQSIRDNRLHHEAFDLAEELGRKIRQIRWGVL